MISHHAYSTWIDSHHVYTVSGTFVPKTLRSHWWTSGCVVECRICNREVAGSNLSLGYFAPRSTQPSIPPGLKNEYQLQLGRQRQVWLIPIEDERVGVHCAGKTVRSLENMCHTWALLRWCFTTKRRYIKCMHPYPLPLRWNFRSLDHSFPGTFVPGNKCSREHSFPDHLFHGTFVPKTEWKSAQRDTNTAHTLAVVRFGHRLPVRPPAVTNPETGPITIHCASC